MEPADDSSLAFAYTHMTVTVLAKVKWLGGPVDLIDCDLVDRPPQIKVCLWVYTLAYFNNKRSTSTFCMPHALVPAETRHHTLHWWATHAVAACIKDAPCYHLTFAFYSYPLPSEYCNAYRSLIPRFSSHSSCRIPQFSSHSSRCTTSKELTRIFWWDLVSFR